MNWGCFYDVLKKVVIICSNLRNEENAYIDVRQMSEHLPQYEETDVFYAMLKLSESGFVVAEVITLNSDEYGVKDIYIKKITDKGYRGLNKINNNFMAFEYWMNILEDND